MELSNTSQFINLVGVTTGLVALCGPIHLCVCVSEMLGDGMGTGCDSEECESGVGVDVMILYFSKHYRL